MKKKYLLFVPAILQLAILFSFDLGVDEAHYMLYARHLALSYFDHPPLIGWMHFLLNFFLGENLFSARILAIVIGAFAAWQTFLFLCRQDFSEDKSLLGSLAAGFSFQIFVLNTFLLPDTLCVFLIWPLMQTTLRLARTNQSQDWLWLGLWLGLAGLAKYTSILLLIPVGVVLVSAQGFSFFKKWGFYAGIGISTVLISPVLIWNSQHAWSSFHYQSSHVLSSQIISWQSFLQSWSLQFGLYSPFLWPFSIWGFLKLWQMQKKTNSLELQFAWWTAAGTLLFFWYASFQNTVLPHWPVLFYLFTMPFGVASAFARKPKLVLAGLAATTSVIFVLVFLLISGLGYRIPQALKDVGGWPEVMQEAGQKLQPGNYLAVTNWTYASRALYYSPRHESQIFVLGDHNDQFDFWKEGDPEGADVLILQMADDEKNLSSMIQCRPLEPAQTKQIFVRGAHIYDVQYQWCRKAHLLHGL